MRKGSKKKRFQKLLAALLATASVVCVYFYTKPAVFIVQKEIEDSLPIKVHPVKSNKGENIYAVYLPYKLEVQNNRLQTLHIMDDFSPVYYEIRAFGAGIISFDTQGFPLTDPRRVYIRDSLLYEKAFVKYTKYENQKSIFPFFRKEYFFYFAYLVKGNVFDRVLDEPELVKLRSDFYDSQSQGLLNKSLFTVRKSLVDSLYKAEPGREMVLNFSPGRSNNTYYRLTCPLNKQEGQRLTNVYEYMRQMSKEELKKYLETPAKRDTVSPKIYEIP